MAPRLVVTDPLFRKALLPRAPALGARPGSINRRGLGIVVGSLVGAALLGALLWFGFLTVEDAATDARWASLWAELVSAHRATQFIIGSMSLWCAAERLPLLQAVHPEGARQPPIDAPAERRREWTFEDALVELVRGRLEGLGPVDAPALAASLAVPVEAVDAALVRLEQDGFALRGRFTAGASTDRSQWCERRLLARIHRYTIQRLRQEIEPVSPQDFMRFLIKWQHAAPAERKEGPDALAAIIAQLEGFEACSTTLRSCVQREVRCGVSRARIALRCRPDSRSRCGRRVACVPSWLRPRQLPRVRRAEAPDQEVASTRCACRFVHKKPWLVP